MADKAARRTLAERKQALIDEAAALAAKELESYRNELAVKTDRLAKVDGLVSKYEAEAKSLNTRVSRLVVLINELETEAAEIDAA